MRNEIYIAKPCQFVLGLAALFLGLVFDAAVIIFIVALALIPDAKQSVMFLIRDIMLLGLSFLCPVLQLGMYWAVVLPMRAISDALGVRRRKADPVWKLIFGQEEMAR